MRRVILQDSWPESWKYSYPYDLIEIYQEGAKTGYAYAYANRRKHTLEMVQKVAKPGASVLDVAAAQGNFSLLLAEMGYEVTWNDLRTELADYVQLKHECGLIHFAPGNVFDLNAAGKFDVVLITEIIEHVAHPDEFLRKISRLSKPGGHIVMTTPNGRYVRNHLPKFSDCADPSQFEGKQFQPNADGHIFLLHPDEIESLARQAGLNVIETETFTNLLTNGHLKTERLLKVLPANAVSLGEKISRSLPLRIRHKVCTGMAVLLQRPE